MTETHTPRQTVGQGLVPVTVMLTPDERAQMQTRAVAAKRSVSYVIRAAVQRSLVDCGGTSDGLTYEPHHCPGCAASAK